MVGVVTGGMVGECGDLDKDIANTGGHLLGPMPGATIETSADCRTRREQSSGAIWSRWHANEAGSDPWG